MVLRVLLILILPEAMPQYTFFSMRLKGSIIFVVGKSPIDIMEPIFV